LSLSYRNLALVVLLVAGSLWWVLRDDAEGQIRAAHEQLAGLLNKTEDEGGAAAILNARALRRLFAEAAQVSGDAQGLAGVYSPEELAGTIVRLRGMFQTIDLTFSELSIAFPDSEDAIVEFTAVLNAAGQIEAVQDVSETRRVTTRMQEVDGTWLFAEFLLTL
jgi:hypothetical protein